MAEPLRFQHYEVPLAPDGRPLELGRGAMGITYRAFDTNLRSDVALKVISGAYLTSDVARERFLREARAAAQIRHPNVASVFHLGDADGSYFYAMEFIDGETVEHLMTRQGALPTLRALEIAEQVARALGAAQKQGLVHRDIKPSNLMLVREADDDVHVKVIDFGLAKATSTLDDNGDAPTLTMGGFLGTPHFASPEQLDERELDVRSDIYSLGVTLFYMLSGEVPFGGSLAQIVSRQLQHDPPWEKLNDQPPEVRDLLVGMMAKDPADRIGDPLELRRRIEHCIAVVRQGDGGSEGGGAAVELADTDPAPELAATVANLAAGDTVAGGYALIEEIPPGPLGRRFRARRLATGEVVCLILIDPARLPTAQARTRFEDAVLALQRVRHPTVLRVDGLEDAPPHTWITHEWANGPTLLDELRGCGAFPPSRAAKLVERMAAGLQEIERADAPSPLLALVSVRLTGDEPKIDPLRFESITDHPEQATLVESSVRRLRTADAFRGRRSEESAFALASIAYELLGGLRSGAADAAFVPVSGLSEEANATLRRGLDSADGFSSAGEFARALRVGLERSSDRAVGAPTLVSTPTPSGSATPSRPWQRPSWRALALIGGAFAGLLILGIALRPRSPAAEPPNVSVEASPTAQGMPTPPPTAATLPSPNDDLLRARDQAAVGDFAAAFATAASVAVSFPQANLEVAETYRAIANRLRHDGPADPTKLADLEPSLVRAAAAGSVDASYLLAQMYDQRAEPARALPLYRQTAEAGDPEAMTKVGAAYAAGWGVDQSWPDAIAWFERAAALDEPAAYYALGEIHALGKGVPRDVNRAFPYLDIAATGYNHPLAQILLGDLYRDGSFGSPNFAEAYRLFDLAAVGGSRDARAKQAVMIYNGEVVAGKPVSGTPKPSAAGRKEAFEIFAEGAATDHPLSLYYHGNILYTGEGAPGRDRGAGRDEITRAARAGNRLAIAWCRRNNVEFEPAPAEPSANPSPVGFPESP